MRLDVGWVEPVCLVLGGCSGCGFLRFHIEVTGGCRGEHKELPFGFLQLLWSVMLYMFSSYTVAKWLKSIAKQSLYKD